jgi:hypothetical protein
MPREAVGAGSVFELSWLAGIITSPGLVAVLIIVEHEKAATLKGAARMVSRDSEGYWFSE